MTRRLLSYHPKALEELEEFLSELTRIEPRLAARAEALFRHQVDRIREYPESGPAFWRSARKVLLRPFKTLVLYKIEASAIVIVAVVDGRMDPQAIRRRLNDRGP